MKVAIAGGGFAGFELAKRLEPHVDVTLNEARETVLSEGGTRHSPADLALVDASNAVHPDAGATHASCRLQSLPPCFDKEFSR